MKTFLSIFVFLCSMNFANAQIDSTKVYNPNKIPENAALMSNKDFARMIASERKSRALRKNTVFLYKSNTYGFDEFMEKFQTKDINVLKIITDKKAIAKLTRPSVKCVILVK